MAPSSRAAAKMGPPRQQWTKTSPPFLMAMGAPEVSQVSKGVQLNGLHEPRYTAYWQSLTARCCASGGLVVDVGANLGWFSLLSARMGCRVLAFEPVPAIAALFMASAKLNNLSHRISLHRAVASDDPTHQPVHLHFQAHSWDTSSIDGTASGNNRSTLIRAPSATLDAFVSESPCALKVDVEGYEPAVLRGGAASFKRYPPRVVMLEYTPGALERKAAAGHPNALDGAPAFPSMLRTLLEHEAGSGDVRRRRLSKKDATKKDATTHNRRRLSSAGGGGGGGGGGVPKMEILDFLGMFIIWMIVTTWMLLWTCTPLAVVAPPLGYGTALVTCAPSPRAPCPLIPARSAARWQMPSPTSARPACGSSS